MSVDRGYVHPEDERPGEAENGLGHGDMDHRNDTHVPSVREAVVTVGGEPIQRDDEEDDGIKPLPERLVLELTAHRTLALRDAVANNPSVAMTALLHRLVSDAFRHCATTGVLDVTVRQIVFPAQADDLKDSASAKSVTERHAAWAAEIPNDDDALWDWIAALDDTRRMALLAHCVSYGINALSERPNPHSGSGVSEHGLRVRTAQACRLAQATGLDMVRAGWRPTVGDYLGRITKARILQSVREGAGERAALSIDHMKKDDMAQAAERLLADSGWLPEPLRLIASDCETSAKVRSSSADDGENPPGVLADDDTEDESSDIDDDDGAVALAAE